MAESQADNNPDTGRPTPRGGADGAEKPKIGDSRPAPKIGDSKPATAAEGSAGDAPKKRRRRRGGRGRGRGGQGGGQDQKQTPSQGQRQSSGPKQGGNRGGGGRGKKPTPIESIVDDDVIELDEKALKQRRGRTRNGQAVGRYLMCVSVGELATQIATLEGRKLVEHQVSRPADDISQIHGNIYIGRVQNVLPGMEAAFVDIATPKNAVLYRGDVQYDPADVEKGRKEHPRIEEILKAKQAILCQVTKNPIAHKGARLTQEVSLPGRFVVLVPNSSTYGISKRLPDGERKRLRNILDKAKPKHHGVIVRTAAENVTSEEIERDVRRLVAQWDDIEALAKKTKAPALLYREPEAAVRIIREEFTKDFRGIIIDDRELYEEIKGYVASITPALADRVEFYDTEAEGLPLFERQHIDEQLRKALDRKVWLPSGGSLIIEGTEALTVIDVNTGKNVGRSSLEETVFRNNLEAAEEVAHQLRLRDIGGIIVIDFVDMEIAKNRAAVVKTFRDALARDKTRTQVFDISELGLVEMTRKRIGEGLLESVSDICPTCDGRGHVLIEGMLG
jgi:ribonuclease E